MRFKTRFLIAAALVLPAGAVAVQNVGPAWAVGTTCAHAHGTAIFRPPLPVVNDPATVTPKIITNNGVITGCSGGGVTGATFTVRAHFNQPTNCKILLTGAPTTNPPTGKIFTTWNTGQTSTARITLKQVSGNAAQTHIVGKVVAGLFLGLHVDQTLSFTPKSGDCASTQLRSVTFKEVTSLKIS